jgi:hypothetical protein
MRVGSTIPAALVAAIAVGAAPGGTGASHFDHSDFQVDTSENLLDLCTAEASDPGYEVARGFCYGFFEGGIAFHDALHARETRPRLACPEGVTLDQVVAVFVAYARANPQYLGEAPMETVFRAAVDKWPCPAPPGGAAPQGGAQR